MQIGIAEQEKHAANRVARKHGRKKGQSQITPMHSFTDKKRQKHGQISDLIWSSGKTGKDCMATPWVKKGKRKGRIAGGSGVSDWKAVLEGKKIIWKGRRGLLNAHDKRVTERTIRKNVKGTPKRGLISSCWEGRKSLTKTGRRQFNHFKKGPARAGN